LVKNVTDVIEYSKSARAGCKGKCKEKIDKGVLRFGSITDRDGHAMTYWRHFPDCMTAQVAENAITKYLSAGQIPGVSDLEAKDQKMVADELAKLSASKAEKAAGGKKKQVKSDEEDNEAESKPKTPAKKKAKPTESEENAEEEEKPKKKAPAKKNPKEPKAEEKKPKKKAPAKSKSKKKADEDDEGDDE
jgi:hypothetical protein